MRLKGESLAQNLGFGMKTGLRGCMGALKGGGVTKDNRQMTQGTWQPPFSLFNSLPPKLILVELSKIWLSWIMC